MVCHTTLLISKIGPIKYIFEKHVFTVRIARWKILLTEYNIQYVAQKDMKGSVLYDYLAHQPVKGYQPMRFDFPDEYILFIRYYEIPSPDEGSKPGLWCTLVFDGASNGQSHGIGPIITSLTSFQLPFTARLCFDSTNNMVEYETCIFGIESTIDLRIKILEVYRDSIMVISQIKGD